MGQRGREEGGQREWMTDALWLRLCPPFIGASSPFAGQRRGCRDRSPGYQDEKWRRDKKERLSALDVKRKQLRDTEKGGGQ